MRVIAIALLVLCLVLFILGEFVLGATYAFTIKTKGKGGSIIGNVTISAPDQYAAETKLKKRYPGCEIRGVKVKP